MIYIIFCICHYYEYNLPLCNSSYEHNFVPLYDIVVCAMLIDQYSMLHGMSFIVQ